MEHFARITLVAELLGGAEGAAARRKCDKLFDSRDALWGEGARSAGAGMPDDRRRHARAKENNFK